MLDDKERFELLRDIAEHNAMFMNSEGVQQVRDARQNTYSTSAEDFKSLIKDQFGRDLPQDDAEDITENTLDPYLNIDFDDIKFIPYDS